MLTNQTIEIRQMRLSVLPAIFSCVFLLLGPQCFSRNCECPVTFLGLEECGKYGIIFKGKVRSVKECGDRPGEAQFEVEELYKGNLSGKITMLFRCKDPCFMGFYEGQEWIIYTDFRQIGSAMMDWCSRSRRYYRIEKEDIYSPIYGNTYEEELEFLRKTLGLHRLRTEDQLPVGGRNIIPDKWQVSIILICSLAAIVLFYYLFNRYFR
jgi:hypothetical protein